MEVEEFDEEGAEAIEARAAARAAAARRVGCDAPPPADHAARAAAAARDFRLRLVPLCLVPLCLAPCALRRVLCCDLGINVSARQRCAS